MQNWSNIHRVPFKSTYEGYPIIKAERYVKCDTWIGLNEVLSYKGDKSTTGVHFFIDDYQFERVYNAPRKWIEILKEFKCVLTPDFSAYTDFPKPIRIYNKFRNQWCGALWQKFGLRVYPTMVWSDRESYAWSFDGFPVGGTVAVSNVGCMDFKESFLEGYNTMVKILKPKKILLFGSKMDELQGNIEYIKIGGFHGK